MVKLNFCCTMLVCFFATNYAIAKGDNIYVGYFEPWKDYIDAAKETYLEIEHQTNGLSRGDPNNSKYELIECSRQSPIQVSDIQHLATWSFDGYDETQSLVNSLDDLSFRMATFEWQGLSEKATISFFSKFVYKFGVNGFEILYDGVPRADEDGELGRLLESHLKGLNIPFPGLYHKDSCGGGVELFLKSEPENPRLWFTTPIREFFCNIQEFQNNDCETWWEITGQRSISVNGNVVLYARWNSGKSLRYHVNILALSEPYSVFLKEIGP